MISILAKFTVKSGGEKRFHALINQLIKASKAEEGCLEYALQKHVEKPSHYCLIEKYKDRQAVDAHNSSAHFTDIVPKLLEVATAEVDVYEAV